MEILLKMSKEIMKYKKFIGVSGGLRFTFQGLDDNI